VLLLKVKIRWLCDVQWVLWSVLCFSDKQKMKADLIFHRVLSLIGQNQTSPRIAGTANAASMNFS
jgi:hypothetical protein